MRPQINDDTNLYPLSLLDRKRLRLDDNNCGITLTFIILEKPRDKYLLSLICAYILKELMISIFVSFCKLLENMKCGKGPCPCLCRNEKFFIKNICFHFLLCSLKNKNSRQYHSWFFLHYNEEIRLISSSLKYLLFAAMRKKRFTFHLQSCILHNCFK